MAIKKTELYSSLWASCNELRGGMDASQYKDYVLTLLFVKYVSDTFGNDPYGLIEIPEGGSFTDMLKLKGDKEVGDKVNKIIAKLAEENELKGVIDVADFNDEDKLGKGKAMIDRLSSLLGIFEGLDLSSNRAEGDDLLGDAYEYLMRHFATESGKSKGQFYTPAEVSRILAKVVGITPDTSQDKTVYDPTCGSGSLLLKVNDEAPRGLSVYGQEMDNATYALARMNMILHGCASHEMWQDNTLASPHWKSSDGGLETFDFAVANPPFSFKAWNTGIKPDEDEFGRFEYGIPPEKNGDYAFLLHILKSLKQTGKGAVILPHGVLFRGNVEADIRQKLIRQGVIKGIIGLPANLFYGTGIPACIIVIDKQQANARKAIFMIDASKGFIKDGNKNRLREQDIHKIVDVFNKQIETQGFARLVSFSEIEKNEYNLNIPRYIDGSEAEDIHDLHAHLHGGIPNADIDALQNYWDVFPTLRNSLFTDNPTQGYSDALVATSEVKQSILDNQEYQAFKQQSTALFDDWKQTHHTKLKAMELGTKPKDMIQQLSEDLLARFATAKLLSKYTIYQILMDYWNEPMQDDVYIITQDGWQAGNIVREIVPIKDKNNKTVYKEAHDFEFGTARNKKRYKSDLIPPQLVINRFFADEQNALNTLQQQQDQATQMLESLVEENSGEESVLAEVNNKTTANEVKQRYYDLIWQKTDITTYEKFTNKFEISHDEEKALLKISDNSYLNILRNDKGKLTLKAIKERLSVSQNNEEKEILEKYLEQDKKIKAIQKEYKALRKVTWEKIDKKVSSDSDDLLDDIVILNKYLSFTDEEAKAKKEVKEAQAALNKQVFEKIPQLKLEEIKTLVIEDKWYASLETEIQAEIERVTQQLANRVRTLEERYKTPLPKLADKVEELSAKVEGHLRTMGVLS